MTNNVVPHFVQLRIGTVGSLEVKLPAVVVGPTLGPKSIVIAGSHGNERTGFWILKKLLDELQRASINRCIMFLPVANPVAFALNVRVDPLTHVDLNRVFPGNTDGTIVDRIAKIISTIVQGRSPVKELSAELEIGDSGISRSEAEHYFELPVDLVVDLHTFGLQLSEPTGILATSGLQVSSAEERSRELLLLASPKMVWWIDASDALTVGYRGSLGPYLSSLGIPNFAIETQDLPLATSKVVERIVSGLMVVLGDRGTGTISSGSQESRFSSRRIPIYRRHWQRSSHAGLFLPEKRISKASIGRSFSRGQVIGQFISTNNLSAAVVKAEWSCDLNYEKLDLMLIAQGLVGTGDEVCSWGELVGSLGE